MSDLSPRSGAPIRSFLMLSAVLFVVHIALGSTLDDFVIAGDGPEYLRMAENLIEGRGFTYDGSAPVVGKPPGFPTLIAAHLATVGSLQGFHLVQLCLLFAGYFAIAWLTVLAFGHLAGLTTLALLVAADPIRNLAANLMSEPLYIALFSLGFLAFYLCLKRRSWTHAITAGLLFGLATYVRPISLLWPVACVLLFALVNRRLVRVALLSLVIHLVVVSPWIVRNAVLFKQFVPMVANWGPMYGMADDVLWKRYLSGGWVGGFKEPRFMALIGPEFPYNWPPQERLRNATMLGISQDIQGWLIRCFKQSSRAWTYVPGTKEWATTKPALYWTGRVTMLLFYIACIFGAWRSRRSDSILNALLGGLAFYSAVMLFPVTVESRYLVPVYACLVPLAVTGAIHTLSYFWNREHF